jgi:hypothetical protein
MADKKRSIVALSVGAAVGLSAVSVVLLEDPGVSSQRVKAAQTALRDGVTVAQASPDVAKWVVAARMD